MCLDNMKSEKTMLYIIEKCCYSIDTDSGIKFWVTVEHGPFEDFETAGWFWLKYKGGNIEVEPEIIERN